MKKKEIIGKTAWYGWIVLEKLLVRRFKKSLGKYLVKSLNECLEKSLGESAKKTLVYHQEKC